MVSLPGETKLLPRIKTGPLSVYAWHPLRQKHATANAFRPQHCKIDNVASRRASDPNPLGCASGRD